MVLSGFNQPVTVLDTSGVLRKTKEIVRSEQCPPPVDPGPRRSLGSKSRSTLDVPDPTRPPTIA